VEVQGDGMDPARGVGPPVRTSLSFAEYFFSEFMERMRASGGAGEKPGPRQSINMHRLLLSRFMRRGRITYYDLAEIATVTSKPSSQPLARRIAWDIIRVPEAFEDGVEAPTKTLHRPYDGAPSPKRAPHTQSHGKAPYDRTPYTQSQQTARRKEGEGKKPQEAAEHRSRLSKRFVRRILDFFRQIAQSIEDRIRGSDKKVEGRGLESLAPLIEETSSEVGSPEGAGEEETGGAEILDTCSIGLLPGPGEDNLLKLYSMLESDAGMRSRLRKILRRRLMEIGLELESVSCRPGYRLRPFEAGEDPTLIDEERSLEHIFVDLGKRAEEVEYRDFLMKKRTTKPKTVIFLQDISNSMYEEHEKAKSIQYSVLALIPLMYALRRIRYGLALFESNTHVMKDLFETRDEAQLADTLLYFATSHPDEVRKRFWNGEYNGQMCQLFCWGGNSPKHESEVGG